MKFSVLGKYLDTGQIVINLIEETSAERAFEKVFKNGANAYQALAVFDGQIELLGVAQDLPTGEAVVRRSELKDRLMTVLMHNHFAGFTSPKIVKTDHWLRATYEQLEANDRQKSPFHDASFIACLEGAVLPSFSPTFPLN